MSGFSGVVVELIKVFHKMYKLLDMGLEDPVFAVYDIKIPGMSGLVKGKEKKLVCFFQIGSGAC